MSLVGAIDQYRKKDWWFFDTNCLSELVKRFNRGEKESVQRFIKGKYVLIQIANLLELTKTAGLLEEVPLALSTAAFVGVTRTVHPFIQRDLYSHLGFDRLNPNPLGLYELTEELSKELPHHQGFRDAVAQSNAAVQSRYIGKVTQDIEADFLTPVMVYGHAKVALKSFIESILGLEKDHDLPKRILKNPRTFPSHFTYWAAYRFLYLVDRNVKAQANDFNDLSFTLAAPICERFYTEKRLAHVLKQVKGYEIPSERMVVAAALRHDTTKTKREKQTELARYPDVRGRVLKTTGIFTFADLQNHLQAHER
jgi:hypothetical protein